MALPTRAEFMLKKNKPFLLLTLGAAVLLIGGSLAAYWLRVKRDRVLGEAPVGSQLVPQDALLTASISTDSAQWQQLQLYGTPETKAVLEQQLTQLRDNLLTANGYNYEQDIRPMLGKTAMIAYIGSRIPATGAKPGQFPGLGNSWLPDLIVLPMTSPTQAQQLLEKTKSQKATQFFERTYKGIQIRETHKNNGHNYSITVLGSFLVVTSNPRLTERVIDTYKGAASVATTPGYLESLPEIKTSAPFALVYLNVPVLSAVLATNSLAQRSPEKIVAQQQMQGVASTLVLEPQGMRFQGISWLKPNSSEKYRVENTATRLPRRLPADTLLMVSGGNLTQMLESYAQGTETNPLLPIKLENLNANLRAALGLDFENDFLSWMGNEFSLALIPASPEVLALPESQQAPPLGVGVVLMVEARDRTRAQATLKQLDQVMATRYGFQSQETKLGSQPVVNLVSPFGGVSVTHGWLEGNIVFLTLGAPIASAILPEPQVPLIQTPLFQQAVPAQPTPYNGQFFLDVERTINKGNLNWQKALSPEQKLLAKAIRAIGLTSAIEDRRSTRFDLFVQMKTAIIPSPTPVPESASSPSAKPTPKTPQTSSSSPSATPTPQKPQASSSSPSVSPTPKTSPSPSVSTTPQTSPNSSP
ncbi:MAG: DUF3352 domain-containing protein [Cyanobacteriota bacterium]